MQVERGGEQETIADQRVGGVESCIVKHLEIDCAMRRASRKASANEPPISPKPTTQIRSTCIAGDYTGNFYGRPYAETEVQLLAKVELLCPQEVA